MVKKSVTYGKFTLNRPESSTSECCDEGAFCSIYVTKCGVKKASEFKPHHSVRGETLSRTFMTSRGQVTIFIIVGLLVLMIFLFLMMISSNVRKSQLEGEKEKVFGSTFKKEALRIYVEDCLQDELTKSLILLGKQGRIWSDQPGGRKAFVEGLSGVISPQGDRVAYAITHKTYLQYPEAYPCDTEDNPPAFCHYKYPNVSFPFGELRMKESTLKEDLSNYLINRTVWCVQNFTASNISSKAEIETTAMDMNLDLQEDGIAVKVNYPITFKVGGESFSHISTFDFFYPTKFKQLLDAAVSFPLRHDTTHVDFKYDTATLSSPFFSYVNKEDIGGCNLELTGFYSCHQGLFGEKFTALGINLFSSSLVNGDDLFTLTPALYTIVNSPDSYSFNFVRQNRQPALDYISRDACDSAGYDYLAVEGADGELGKINFKASAIDPDEEVVSYGIYNDPQNSKELNNELKNVIPYDQFQSSSPKEGWYNVTAIVTDGHLEDRQKVRILVDRKVNPSVGLKFPDSYGIKSDIGLDTYLVSLEDPIFLVLNIPVKSLADGKEGTSDETKIIYNDGTAKAQEIGSKLPSSQSLPTGLCYNLPLGSGACDLTQYKEDYLKHFKEDNTFYFNFFRDKTESGKLSLDYTMNYCGKLNPPKKIEKNIIVKECVPVQNQQHPYSFPYEKFTFEVGQDKKTDFSKPKPDEVINPFEATHSCCLGSPENDASWYVAKAEDNVECFMNPKKDCYGRSDSTLEFNPNKGNPNSFGGYILEEQYATCDGVSGNMCNGGRKYRLAGNTLTCGIDDNDHPSCFKSNKIPNACQGKPAWSFVDTNNDELNDGWCNGDLGCSKVCINQPIVAEFNLANNFNYLSYINEKIKTISSDKNDNTLIGFHCGCTADDYYHSRSCGFDGQFKGKCGDIYSSPGMGGPGLGAESQYACI